MSSELLQRAEKALVALDAEALVSLYAEDFLFEDTSSGDRITDTLSSLKKLVKSKIGRYNR